MAADVRTSLKDWSTTVGSNLPTGSTSISTNLDDNLCQIQATVRYETASRDTIASATTCDLGTKDAGSLDITGTTTITSFGTVSAGIRKLVTFSGALTLTHNGTSLKLPGSANITTVAGDTALFESLGSGNWNCLFYQRKSGLSVTETSAMADGSVSAPGLSFTNDANTGLYRITTDQIGISAGGVLSFKLTSTTNETTLPITSTLGSASGTAHAVTATGSSQEGFTFTNVTQSNNGSALSSRMQCGSSNGHVFLRETSNSTTNYFAVFVSSDGADTEFSVRTDGTVSSDAGTSMSSPADYAEMFEWADGNPAGEDRVGYSVALVGEKIRIASAGDDPIGVVSGNPAVLADAGETRWAGKYLRDDFNRLVLNGNGERTLNPAFDMNAEYTPRAKRKEWSPVGLVGKLRVRKGQVVGPSWKLMREVSATVDEYLVR